MLVVNEYEVKPKPFVGEDAKGVVGKYLLTDEQGAQRFHFRIFIVEPGGYSPFHRHIYEHEVYVLRGRGKVIIEENGVKREVKVGVGDVIFIESNEPHQFLNDGVEPFIFICVRGTEKIY